MRLRDVLRSLMHHYQTKGDDQSVRAIHVLFGHTKEDEMVAIDSIDITTPPPPILPPNT